MTQRGVGELPQISALWEMVSISTNPENFTEIGPQTFEKTPFKHAPRKFGLSFLSRVVTSC